MIRIIKILSAMFLITIIGCSENNSADLIVHNAKIYTVNNSFEMAEAMVIDSGKIIAIGPQHEILNKYTASKVIDAMKHPIYPGFIDANCNFIEYAFSLIKDDSISAILNAQQKLFEMGITSINAVNLSKPDIELIRCLQQDSKLKLKVYAMIKATTESLEYYLKKEPDQTGKLKTSAFAFYSDSILESELFKDKIQQLYLKGYQLNTYCTDTATSIILDVYEKVLKGVNDRRWRIQPNEINGFKAYEKFKANTIIPSITSNKGEILNYKKILDQNGIITIGSDFPNKEINPFIDFYEITTNGSLSREETLRAMTIWAAISNFEENEKGSLEVGKSADFIILDNDLLETTNENILKVKVFQTFINGENVFSQKK